MPDSVLDISTRYQALLQQRIELECKLAQFVLSRSREDEVKLRNINKQISELEKTMYSADSSMGKSIDALYPEHASYASKIHS